MTTRNISIVIIIVIVLLLIFINVIDTKILGLTLGLLVFLQILILIRLQTEQIPNKLKIHGHQAPSELTKHILNQVTENYNMTRSHTELALIVTLTMIILGFTLIAVSCYAFITKGVDDASVITLISGVVVEFISATALYVYNRNSNQLKKTTNKLELTMSYLVLFDKSENDEQLRLWVDKFNELINED